MIGTPRLARPSAWGDLVALHADFSLRVLVALDQEVFADDVPRTEDERLRCNELKAAVREGSVPRDKSVLH